MPEASMNEKVTAICFRITLVNSPLRHGLQVEGEINSDFERHIKTCADCRRNVVQDLRQFANQIERSRNG